MKTKEIEFWNSSFGREYTERNKMEVAEQDQWYLNEYGTSRSEMNRRFLNDVQLDRILEVGCNVGNQLRCLQCMGYENLYGIEIQPYAVERAKDLSRGINIIKGSAFDIPFKDSYFDLVFTSGVLIHISPQDIELAIDEMFRMSRRYIWGFEYYSEQYQEINYRGYQEKMWKTDFKQLFLDRHPTLKLIKEEKFKYLQNDNVDQMFLMEKV